ETLADVAGEREAAFEAALVEVVVEQPTHAAGLVAVLQVEVLVAPLLVARIDVGTMRLAQLARHRVPMAHVLVVRIERGEVEAATEPPDRFHALLAGLEVTHVGMR